MNFNNTYRNELLRNKLNNITREVADNKEKILTDFFKAYLAEHLKGEKIMANKKFIVVNNQSLSEYDCGLINDYGGGDVEWWQNYIREEVARANSFWCEQIEQFTLIYNKEED